MPEEFKKSKPPTFDGDMKKEEDAEAWLLGMKKFFKIHEYSKNMKARITNYSLKWKTDILVGIFENVGGIAEKELNWNEFKNLFRDK